MAQAGSARWIVGVVALGALLATGAWLLIQPTHEPSLLDGTPPPAPALRPPGAAPSLTPSAVPAEASAQTPPVAPPTGPSLPTGPTGPPGPTADGSLDADAAAAPAAPLGYLDLRVQLPSGVPADRPRTVQFLRLGMGDRLAPARSFPLRPQGGAYVARLGPLVAGDVRFVLEIPGVASGGPFAALVPAEGTGEAGVCALHALGTVVVLVEPAPSPAQPVAVLLTDRDSPDAPSRRRQLLATGSRSVLANLPAGRYRCEFRAAGRAFVARDVEAVGGEERELAVALPTEARCEVRVLDVAGRTPPTLYLELELPDGTRLRAGADPRSRASLRPLTLLAGRLALTELPAGYIGLAVARSPSGPFAPVGALQLEAGDNAPAAFTWRE